MRHYRNYTNEDVINFSKEATSIADLLKKLGLKPRGGNYSNIKKIIQFLKIETPHWKGKAWNKGERLKDWSNYSRAVNCKKHLIKIRGNKCEECQLDKWRGELIKLEIHHKDGDKTNNDENNLQLVCPNCHSFTKTWKKNNLKKICVIG